MSAENLEKDEESTNSSLKKSAKVSNEKGPANDGVSISTFQPYCSYQENFKEKDQIASSSSMGFLNENLQDGHKLTIKGKEKVVCENDHADKESDDSNESVESTGIMMSKRKRPLFFSNNLSNSGSKRKRLKTEGNESSFVNWISKIANGFASGNQPALVTPPSVAKQHQTDENGPSSSTHKSYENHPSGKTLMPFNPIGFSSFFHALYRQNNTISLYGSKREAFPLEKSSRNEDNYGLNANRTNPCQDEVRPDNQNEGWACVLQTADQFNSTSNNESRSSDEKRSRDTDNRYLDNFWLTRLLPKEASSSQPPIENDAIDLNKEVNDNFDEKTDQKLKSNFNLIQPSSMSKESKAIVSMFARRLGAIKHAKPLNCKNQSDMEMEGCNSPKKDRRMVLWLGDRDTNANEANREKNIGLMEVGCSSADRGGSGTNGNRAMLNPNFLVHVASEDTAIIEAVRRLRLSRNDVMRWMKLQIQQATLDGLFLRLRLGKLNGAVGRSGYYVARINGLSGEKRLSVSIGKISCFVEFHCISNQDFLEDELKDWFNAGQKGDFRLPSMEELDGKLKERDLVVKK